MMWKKEESRKVGNGRSFNNNNTNNNHDNNNCKRPFIPKALFSHRVIPVVKSFSNLRTSCQSSVHSVVSLKGARSMIQE